MDIKIKCTAAEFGSLVRTCERGRIDNYCSGCALGNICADAAENGSGDGIENFASFELEAGGAADG